MNIFNNVINKSSLKYFPENIKIIFIKNISNILHSLLFIGNININLDFNILPKNLKLLCLWDIFGKDINLP